MIPINEKLARALNHGAHEFLAIDSVMNLEINSKGFFTKSLKGQKWS